MLDPIVKTNLLYSYCGSFCGSVLRDLQREMQLISSLWQITLRRLWNIPYNTHSDICALGGNLPLPRVIHFHFSCLKSQNGIISSVCNHSIFDGSVLSTNGGNLRFLCERYSLSLNGFQLPNNRIEVTIYLL